MKIVLTGATGYIGRPLVAALQAAGHEVVVLTRRVSETSGFAPGVRAVSWDGRTAADSWVGELDGAGAVINLAGANIGEKRWTEDRKHELRQSRLDATQAVVEALQRTPEGRRPGVLVNTSGIDYYGDRGDEVVTEESPPGDSFLARLCVDWEEAALKAEPLGVRVVLMRTAVVFGRGAVALERLALPFKLFAGGPLGSGNQWFSWIHLDDIVGLYRLAVENGGVKGPLNAVAPDVRRAKDVAKEVGRVLGRPSWAPAPAVALKLILGEQADLVLHGRRAEARKALGLGYDFKYGDLHGALSQALTGV
ncbi:MAG: TIGR01777 family oxidoreductase [Chloroflexota bacterium]|nr:TIGR01777 family oxidoreductase [Chloroflexota bacterium]